MTPSSLSAFTWGTAVSLTETSEGRGLREAVTSMEEHFWGVDHHCGPSLQRPKHRPWPAVFCTSAGYGQCAIVTSARARPRFRDWVESNIVYGQHGRTMTRHDHIKSVLQQLHWLPVEQGIKYKLLFRVYRSLSDLATSVHLWAVVGVCPFQNAAVKLWEPSGGAMDTYRKGWQELLGGLSPPLEHAASQCQTNGVNLWVKASLKTHLSAKWQLLSNLFGVLHMLVHVGKTALPQHTGGPQRTVSSLCCFSLFYFSFITCNSTSLFYVTVLVIHGCQTC